MEKKVAASPQNFKTIPSSTNTRTPSTIASCKTSRSKTLSTSTVRQIRSPARQIRGLHHRSPRLQNLSPSSQSKKTTEIDNRKNLKLGMNRNEQKNFADRKVGSPNPKISKSLLHANPHISLSNCNSSSTTSQFQTPVLRRKPLFSTPNRRFQPLKKLERGQSEKENVPREKENVQSDKKNVIAKENLSTEQLNNFVKELHLFPAVVIRIIVNYWHPQGLRKQFQSDLKLAQNGNQFAQCRVASDYYDLQEYTTACRYYRLAALQGNHIGQCSLGYCYELGLGVKKNVKEAFQWYQRAAPRSACAQSNLGLCYEKGRGVEKNIKKAFRLYQLASNRGYSEGQLNLAKCYMFGIGIKKNLKEAIRLYQLASNQGSTDAQCILGQCYQEGKGVIVDLKESIRLLKLSATAGLSIAQSSLGRCYYFGIGVTKDFKEAVRWWQLATDQSCGEAQAHLGFCYDMGQGVSTDMKEAIRLYRLAAEQGEATAQVNLGYCYEHGKGVEKNLTEAILHYQLAATQGLALAFCHLASCYETGTGVTQDCKEAVRLYQIAVNKGDAQAQNNLGFCYEFGQGIKQDLKEAIRLYQLSASQGHAPAQYNLGHWYEEGKHVTNDWKQAFKWYKLSGKQGFTKAQRALGECYENGKGIGKNWKEALRWYQLAADQGNVIAKTAIISLSQAQTLISLLFNSTPLIFPLCEIIFSYHIFFPLWNYKSNTSIESFMSISSDGLIAYFNYHQVLENVFGGRHSLAEVIQKYSYILATQHIIKDSREGYYYEAEVLKCSGQSWWRFGYGIYETQLDSVTNEPILNLSCNGLPNSELLYRCDPYNTLFIYTPLPIKLGMDIKKIDQEIVLTFYLNNKKQQTKNYKLKDEKNIIIPICYSSMSSVIFQWNPSASLPC